MTPKEKALEIVDKFLEHVECWDCYNDIPLYENHDIKWAIIVVDEILKIENTEYWQEVKQELELIK